jgi:hypothetical protein
MFGNKLRARDLLGEIESHVEMHTAANFGSGIRPTKARRQARLKLGGVGQTKEIDRERRGRPMIETLLQNLHFGARACCATILDSRWWRLSHWPSASARTLRFSPSSTRSCSVPLPYKDSDQLILITTTNVQKGVKGLRRRGQIIFQ